MTAAVAVMGLVPLALGAGQPGKEILHPLAVVVIGGLIDSTLMDPIVTPAVFFKFGRKVYRPPTPGSDGIAGQEWHDAWLLDHAEPRAIAPLPGAAQPP